jgi:hypothetical protein
MHGYFESGGFRDAGVLQPFLVNSNLEIIFNGLWGIHLSLSKRKKSRILPG